MIPFFCRMDTTDSIDTSQSSKKRRMDSNDSTPEAMEQSTIITEQPKDVISFDGLDTKCLSKIFSKVDIMDLASLGTVCKKFNQISRTIFKQKHQRNMLEIDVKNSLVKTARLLRCFKHQITKLAICYDAKTKANMKIDVLVNKYCAKSLNEIQFSEVGLYSSTRALQTLTKVTHLTVRSGMLSGKLSEIAAWLPNVQHIDIYRNVQPGGIKCVIYYIWKYTFYIFHQIENSIKSKMNEFSESIMTLVKKKLIFFFFSFIFSEIIRSFHLCAIWTSLLISIVIWTNTRKCW